MTSNLQLALQLLTEELDDSGIKPVASLDEVLGALFRELTQLGGMADTSNSELVLEKLIQIAAFAAKGAADLAVAQCKEGA